MNGEAESFETWEEEILAFEREDDETPPPAAPVVFTGSSSIRLWTSLARDMAPLAVLNRGFGGALLHEVVHFAPRIVLPCRPAAVVLYGGENDLEGWRGSAPEEVLGHAEAFAQLVGAELPEARLFLLSLKPSPAREADWPAIERFSLLLRELADAGERRCWVDVASAMRDAAGRPRRELFADDGLHLSPRGYEVWTRVLRPLLLAGMDAGGTGR